MSEPLFRKGESVILRSTMEMGRVEEDPQLEGGEFWYQVRFVKRYNHVVEDDLERVSDRPESLESLVAEGRWGRLQAVRCALGIERIQHTNRSTIYAFQSQRILFEPYQYKPLLKVLDSSDRRVLIADEVGLGKTIEAGLVLTELSARRELERVLVVCPSRLREKWRNELNGKFDEDFEIYDKNGILQAASRAAEKPGRFRMRGIISMQSVRGEEIRRALADELGHIDMVIVDEAHHARNPNTAIAEVLRELCAIGDCVLLLTATPLHLKNDDLFTLVNAMRPAEFPDMFVFNRQLERHAPVHVASALARRQRTENLPQIESLLKSVFCSSPDPGQHDPKAVQVINDLQHLPPTTRREWIELERQIQELHSLGSIVTRTRKRDVVENAPERRARTVLCDWTSEEDEAYQRLVEGSRSLGWLSRGVSMAQIQRARYAASCLPAAYQAQEDTNSGPDVDEILDVAPPVAAVREKFPSAQRSVCIWSSKDSKLEVLEQILRTVWREEPPAKILIFTFFRGTARYLEKCLNANGWPTLRIDGDVPSDPRRPEIDERGKRIRQFESDPEIKVLVSTEVGSEGLDFQFCHHLVNYDLPWNPMVVEQRIGRIDRFGQTSEVVHIHNLVVQGTVEHRILAKLYERIGIFERSIGNLEAILGETFSELEQDFVSGRLTPEEAERRVEIAANAINHRRNDLELLEKQASELFGHEEFIRDEMNRVRNLGRYVSEKSLLALLKTYFDSYHPTVKLKQEADLIHAFRLTNELRVDIQDAARGGAPWIDRSKDGVLQFTTSGDMAFRRKDLDLINAAHPLIRAALKRVGPQLESPLARLGQAKLRLTECGEQSIPAGSYFFVLFAQMINSIRKRRILETVAWQQTTGRILEPEMGERLLYLTIENGLEWDENDPAPSISPDVWSALTSEAKRRNRAIRDAEERENRALYVRRRNALEAEYNHDIEIKETRLRTAELRGRSRIVPAMMGQIDKAKSEFRGKLDELSKLQEVSVTLSDPVAVCAVRVVD